MISRASAPNGKYTPIGFPILAARELYAVVTYEEFSIMHGHTIG